MKHSTSHLAEPRRVVRLLTRLVAEGVLAGVALRSVAAQPGRQTPVVTTTAAAGETVLGTIRSADEDRLVGARVMLLVDGRPPGSVAVEAITDTSGSFQFSAVPRGTVRLAVRRLGFRPETLLVDVPQPPGGPVVVLLRPVAQPLAPLVVRDRGRASGGTVYATHRSSSFGHRITRADIDRQNPVRTSDLFRAIPGVAVATGGSSTALRLRSLGGRDACEPVYFLDGMPLGSGTLDIDALSPASIDAIEIFSGASTVPAALRSPMTSGGCGAVAIWSRRGAAAGDSEDPAASVDTLDAMVAHGTVFTADQVELVATPLPGFGPRPAYPDSLRMANVAGRVLAEFVVDEQGHVDPATFGVVSTTNRLFSAAVRDAVVDARYSPAYRDKHVVRQVVHLPVVFEPASAGTSANDATSDRRPH